MKRKKLLLLILHPIPFLRTCFRVAVGSEWPSEKILALSSSSSSFSFWRSRESDSISRSRSVRRRSISRPLAQINRQAKYRQVKKKRELTRKALLVIFCIISFVIVILEELFEPHSLLLLFFDPFLLLDFHLLVVTELLPLSALPVTQSFLSNPQREKQL